MIDLESVIDVFVMTDEKPKKTEQVSKKVIQKLLMNDNIFHLQEIKKTRETRDILLESDIFHFENDDGEFVHVEISPWSIHYALVNNALKSAQFLVEDEFFHLPIHPLTLYHIAALGNVNSLKFLLHTEEIQTQIPIDLLEYVFSRPSVLNSLYWNLKQKNKKELLYLETIKLILDQTSIDLESKKKMILFKQQQEQEQEQLTSKNLLDIAIELACELEWFDLLHVLKCYF